MSVKPEQPDLIVHATAIAVAGAGLLIRGGSGSGKSGLALELMARGAALISDDRVCITPKDGALWLTAPKAIRGMIEARGIGLLCADHLTGAMLTAVLDLDHLETARMPQRRETMLHGQRIPLLHKTAHPYFAAALTQYLKGGRHDEH